LYQLQTRQSEASAGTDGEHHSQLWAKGTNGEHRENCHTKGINAGCGALNALQRLVDPEHVSEVLGALSFEIVASNTASKREVWRQRVLMVWTVHGLGLEVQVGRF
jgi:hypothetical protein